MNESAPAPVLPPVPWWERAAAVVLALGLIGFVVVGHLRPESWWFSVSQHVRSACSGWVRFLAAPTSQLCNSSPSLRAMMGSLWAAHLLGLPVLIAWAGALASGWRVHWWRNALWWSALIHGTVTVAATLVGSRYYWLSKMLYPRKGSPPPWNEGWFTFISGEAATNRVAMLAYLAAAQILLVGLVLWFTRKQRAKPKAAEGTPAA